MTKTDHLLHILLEADEDDFDAKDVFFDEGGFTELAQLIDRGILSLSGTVRRLSHHYVHERSTNCELEHSLDWPDDMPDERCDAEDERLIKLINELEADINERMVGWNHKIYEELEDAYEGYNSDDSVAENIVANEYEFTEEGEREDGTGIYYEQLTDEAKEEARDWWRRGAEDDNYYSEPVIAEWKWLLDQKGFYGVEINWSGFWSQGDGASFTATSIDFAKYLRFPDLLEFPEQERGQINESEEEDFDAKDLAFGPAAPIGYVLKSKVPGSNFPWFHTRWSDTGNSCGNFRRYIGDAKVYKRLSTAQSYSTLEIVPVYSDPRKNGNGALDPYYVKPVYNFKPRPVEDNPWAEEDVNESQLAERHAGASQERAIFYHGTTARLIPKIIAEGLVPDPPQRSWQEDPHAGMTQPTRKSLEGIYVASSLTTATGAALRSAQRDKVNQAVVVMTLQPRSLVGDEDSVKYGITALAAHLSDHPYSHIWPYFMEFYGDQLSPDYEHYRERAMQVKQDWVNNSAKQLLYKFKDVGVRPELESRVKELLATEGYRAMLERMASYVTGWDKNHYHSEWARGFGEYDTAPPVPDSKAAEEKFLAFSDKLSRTLKDTARPYRMAQWSLNTSGRLLTPVRFSGSNKILCIIEIGRANTEQYHSIMIVHYGKPPTQLIKDWTEAIGPLDNPGDIVYKNNMQEAMSHSDALRTTGFWGDQAAGCIIAARDTKRILLPKRSDQVLQPHTWGTWGGAVDEDENPVKTVQREVAEETGHSGPVQLIPLFIFQKGTFRYHNFLCLVEHEFEPRLNWETEDSAWVNFGDWPEPLHFGLAEVIRRSGQKIQQVLSGLGESEEEDFDTKDLMGSESDTLLVISSSGYFHVGLNGAIIEVEVHDPNSTEAQILANVDRFDITEYLSVYPEESWTLPGGVERHVDILDIGFWSKDGDYTAPNENYRREEAPQQHRGQDAAYRDDLEEASEEDDVDVKDLAQTEKPQSWMFKIEEWPTCKLIAYFIVEDPEEKLHSTEVRYLHPSISVGGHTFPKRTKNSDLRLIAQAQIRQFRKTGRYDQDQWNNVWEWMRAARRTDPSTEKQHERLPDDNTF